MHTETRRDAAAVIACLAEAGATLYCLPNDGHSPRLRLSALAVLSEPGAGPGPIGLPRPTAAQISRMDEAFAWLPLIPDDRYILRRIVAARALTHPASGRAINSFKAIAARIGADPRAVRRWHAEGIDLIVAGLARAAARQGRAAA